MFACPQSTKHKYFMIAVAVTVVVDGAKLIHAEGANSETKTQ